MQFLLDQALFRQTRALLMFDTREVRDSSSAANVQPQQQPDSRKPDEFTEQEYVRTDSDFRRRQGHAVALSIRFRRRTLELFHLAIQRHLDRDQPYGKME